MDNDGNMLDEIVDIIKKKKESPYAKLRKCYGYLYGIMLLICFAVVIGVLYSIIQDKTIALKPMMWLSVLLVFGVPIIAHSISIFLIDYYTTSFSLIDPSYSGKFNLLKGPYLACLGFVISGIICLVVAKIPLLHSAIETLQLGWLYLPVMLAVAVVIPFVLWLVMSILAFLNRKDPFGP